MHDVVVRTERLALRILDTEDAAVLAVPAEWVRRKIVQQERLGFSPWAVTDRSSGEVYGFCGLFWRAAKGITLGYAIVASARGRGYATEAAGAVLGWAEDRQIPVYASVRPPNPASERVLRKIGMELDDHYWDEDGERLVYRRSPNPRSAGRT
ncbi:GNAT family N-acetyltransferase [Actinopolymorpha pittospori]